MARKRIDTIKQLNALPHFAVVYDQANWVWQKKSVNRQVGWATPGVAGTFPVDDVILPAYLLDDGL
jgi:hypothetical protein